jgi:hypothetical protein
MFLYKQVDSTGFFGTTQKNTNFAQQKNIKE